MNIIEFYYNEEDRFMARIISHGKIKTVRNKRNLNKLIEIAKKYGYKIDKECYIAQYVDEIFLEYLNYIEEKRNNKNKVHVFGNITSNMKLNKKNILTNKKLIAATLATTLAISTAAGIPNHVEKLNNSNTTHYTKELDQEENITIEEKEIQKKAEIKEDINKELEEMIKPDAFHFSYKDRSSTESITNAKRYEDLFKKYGNMYGVDSNLLMAIAAQESSGDHYNHIDNGPAEGIMQIEKSAHLGETISAYNFETGNKDTINIDKDKLDDLETNIQIGTIIFRKYLENNNYNIPLTLQTYNFGPGNMEQSLSMCSDLEHIDKDKMKNDPTNNSWLQYRAFLNTGDPEYVEHVFSYLGTDSLSVKNKNNEEIKVLIANDYNNKKQL